ncbi:MAG: nicotinate-nucleotide adenylyltransferase [Planctomycetota bacterium]
MRSGLYGGSFDPIHDGHVAAAEEVLHRRALDRVFFVPAGSPPHKPDGCHAAFEDRLAMARLAAAPIHGLEVLDWEGRRTGPSYSVQTLREFRTRYPEDAIELLVGADMLADLPRWFEADEIVKIAHIAAFARPGESLDAARRQFEEGLGVAPTIVEIPLVDAASSAIRAALAAGRRHGLPLPAEVADYIEERGLYGGLTAAPDPG